MHNTWIYIAVAAITTLLIRLIPITIFRKPIKNKFVRSFLYYVPYITLAVMTFPAIVEATEQPLAGALAMVFGIVLAWIGWGLPAVAASCCVIVLIVEFLMRGGF